MSTVVPLKEMDGEPITTDLDGWTKVDGEPTMKTWIEYSTDSALCGTWTASVGTYRAEYTSFEFVHLIEGKIEITPDGGEPYTVVGGNAFVIEATFKGTWKIIEPVKKHFYIKLK